jgi:hypothetical protein
MFQNKTVFVVGAGASTEVGLPMGTQLKSIIAKKLNIKFKHGRDLESGDREIVNALREYCRNDNSNPNGDINSHRSSAVQVSEGVF